MMSNSNEQLRTLFQKYLENQCTEQELKELFTHFDIPADNEGLHELIEQALDRDEFTPADELLAEQILKRNDHKILQIPKQQRRHFIQWIVATAAAIIIAIPTFYFLTNRQIVTDNHIAKSKYGDDILPDSTVRLVLHDGTTVPLHDVSTDSVLYLDGVSLHRDRDGVLTYTVHPDKEDNSELFNTIQTPTAGMYKVKLADGTLVTLNSGSSLRYPVAFNRQQRKVVLKGEAFFDVAHDKDKPFIVETEKQLVHVLGTQFNVKAYNDDSETLTTLAKGSVQVNDLSNTNFVRLQPGQQSTLKAGKFSTRQVNLMEYLAWKDNMFIFHHQKLSTIMKELARYYNFELDPSSVSSDQLFFIEVKRSMRLSAFLELIEATSNLDFEIKGRRVKIIEK